MPMSRFLAPFGANRTPTRWGDPFVDLQRGVNRAFDDVFRGFGMTPSDEDGSAMVAPRIDIDETDQAIEISAELPGVKQEDVDVSLDDDVLTIRGEKRCERKDERARVSECFYGTFQRAIQLPFAPNPDQVQANFDNGILKVTLPKQEQAQRTRKIQVGGAQDSHTSHRQTSQGQTSQGQTSQGQGMQGASMPPRGAVE